MASVNISGAEILASFEEHLQHLLDCEQFIFDLRDHPSKPLLKEYKGYDGKKLSQWDQDKITAASQYIEKYAFEIEVTDMKKLRPVEALLAELPRLRKAKSVVEGLGMVMRYQIEDEDRVALYKAGKRSLRDRLDTLTKFDDSE